MKYVIFVLVLFGFAATVQAYGNGRGYYNSTPQPMYGNNYQNGYQYSNNNHPYYSTAQPGSLLYTPSRNCDNGYNTIPNNYYNQNYNRSATPGYPGCGNIPSYRNNYSSGCDSE